MRRCRWVPVAVVATVALVLLAVGVSLTVGQATAYVQLAAEPLVVEASVPTEFESTARIDGQITALTATVQPTLRQPATAAEGLVMFSYDVLVSPFADQATLPTATVAAGTTVWLCEGLGGPGCADRGQPFVTQAPAQVARRCLGSGLLTTGRCSDPVRVVARSPGSSGNIRFAAARTDAQVRFPDGAVQRLQSTVTDGPSGGSDPATVVDPIDQRRVLTQLMERLAADLPHDRVVVGAELLDSDTLADGDVRLSVHGWTASRQRLLVLLADAAPPGKRILTSTLEAVASELGQGKKLATPVRVSAFFADVDEAALAGAISGRSRSQAAAALSSDAVMLQRLTLTRTVIPLAPVRSSNIEVVVTAR